MATPPLRTRPLDTFLSDWTWDRFLAAWKGQVGPLPDLRQHIVPLYAPRFSFSTWCWWPRGEEEARLRALQYYVLTHPNGDPLLWFPTMRSGERDTAAYLSAVADSDAVAATLICATLHPYVGYARHVNLLDWPDLPLCRQLYAWSREAAKLPHRAWHHISSSVLPDLPHQDEYGAARLRAFYQPDGLTGESMVADMARYHRVLLNTWRSVTLAVDDVGDVDLVQQLRTAIAEEHAERSRSQQAWRAEQAAREAERVCQAEAFQRRHPRAREWPPQAELLRELVWSMPTTAVAELFGVSDVAVAKLCLKRGVTKPPRGFWRKVEAGLLPHPQGRPAHA